MADRLVIPDEAVRYILFQRTAYLRLPATFLYRRVFTFLPFPLPLYNVAVAFESRLGAARTKALYEADMGNEYRSIKDALPKACSAVLDIGCGVAGIDVFIDRHYAGQKPDFYLLDKSRVEASVYYLYKPRGAFYNSLDVAKAVLVGNGVSDQRVHLLEANDRNEIRIGTQVDLVLSLLSWGFHYPVETYRDRVHHLLAPNGVAILDVRKGTDGLDALRHRFGSVDVILETEKFFRVVARK